jgi:uncharacterized membrane protein
MMWNALWILIAAGTGAAVTWFVLGRAQSPQQRRDYTGLKHHAKVHTFRFGTMLIAWALLVAAFIFYPKYIAQSLRAFSHGVESVADMLPDQLGSYVEIGLRELGGLFWFQITALIIVVRVIFSGIAAVWRIGRRSG